LAALPIDGVYSSVAPWAEYAHGQYCQAGQGWLWDGVEFTVLAPMAGQAESENDRSCVLKITGLKQSFLLTGDIEAGAENLLVERYGETLRSTVLIAPHHGSKTSSSYSFLQQVRPAWVLIPAGYLNRFGFPHTQVMQRYQGMNTQTLITGLHGAISVKTSDSGLEVETSRQTTHRYWMLNTN
jgi:competence protein ComEC